MSEKDPNGLDQHSAGAKLDYGKNRLSLVICGFANALTEVGKVGTYGAVKYSTNGWMQMENGAIRCTDAMLRHLLKEASGELCDPDTNLLHASHLAWNALARLEFIIKDIKEKQNGTTNTS